MTTSWMQTAWDQTTALVATIALAGLMSSSDKLKLDRTIANANVVQYVSPTGNDANDGLSAGAPITLETALNRAPKAWTGTNQIIMAAGTYTTATASYLIPTGTSYGEPLTLLASSFTTALTRTSTTISGVVVTDSTLSMTTDQYKGYVLRFTSGANAVSNIRYTIQSNTATAFTLCHLSLTPAPTAGDTFVVESPAVTWAHSGLRIEGPICALGIKFSSASSSAIISLANGAIASFEACESIGAGSVTIRTNAYFKAIGLQFGSGLGPGLASTSGGSANQYSCFYHHGSAGFTVSTKGAFYGSLIQAVTGTSGTISVISNSTASFLYLDTNQGINVSQASMMVANSTQVQKFTTAGSAIDGIKVDSGSYVEVRNALFTTISGDAIRCDGAGRFKAIAAGSITGSGVTGYGVRLLGGGNASMVVGSTVAGTAGNFKVGSLAAGTWAGLTAGVASADSGATSRGEWIECV